LYPTTEDTKITKKGVYFCQRVEVFSMAGDLFLCKFCCKELQYSFVFLVLFVV
jgi:hypothetical protein